jgi:hypothetical protein
LAREPERPDFRCVRNAAESESVRHSPDAGEEVDLVKSVEVFGTDITDVSLIDHTIRQVAQCDLLSENLAAERVDFVVIGSHSFVF